MTVPVLSRIIAVNCEAICKASPLRISTPISAPFPTPTIIEIGVANPNAHGQAITNTATVVIKTKAALGSGPKLSHPIAVKIATIITTGTKTADTLSTIRPILGLEFCARFTNAIIWAKAVSFPTRVAR